MSLKWAALFVKYYDTRNHNLGDINIHAARQTKVTLTADAVLSK
jgi:hypothetical protein